MWVYRLSDVVSRRLRPVHGAIRQPCAACPAGRSRQGQDVRRHRAFKSDENLCRYREHGVPGSKGAGRLQGFRNASMGQSHRQGPVLRRHRKGRKCRWQHLPRNHVFARYRRHCRLGNMPRFLRHGRYEYLARSTAGLLCRRGQPDCRSRQTLHCQNPLRLRTSTGGHGHRTG
ncbi:hypothetical protein D3C76_1048410 [compost metagenome]